MKTEYVKCVNANGFDNQIHVGGVYEVLGASDVYFRVYRDDNGEPSWYGKTRFVHAYNSYDPDPTDAPTETTGRYRRLAEKIGDLVDEKNVAYGSSVDTSVEALRLLYPSGVPVEKYGDLLLQVRIWDKQMRIANQKDAFGESPYRDIAGYGILGAARDSAKAAK